MVLSLLSKGIHSLKEKRQIVSSIKEKLKNKYNISIIESDYQNSWQKIQLAIAMVSHSKDMIQKTFEQIEDFIYLNYPIQMVTIDKEFL